MRKLIFFILFLLVGAMATFWAYFPQKSLWKQHKTDQIVQEKRDIEFLLEASKRVSQLWREGDVEGLWKSGQMKCPKSLGKAFDVGDDYLKCNPRFILCALEDKALKIDLNGEEREVVLNQADYRLVTPANSSMRYLPRASYLFELRLENGRKTMPLLLEEDCHEVFLPERIYKAKSFVWDNYKANVFLDKFLVSFAQVADWARFGGDTKIELPKTQEELAGFAYGLTLEQMQAYCAFKGKQLMSSEFFDAASFYPADLANPEEEEITNAPYPWTRKKKITEEEALCSKIYSEECLLKHPLRKFGTEAPTWSGMFLALGGPLEAMMNPLEPDKNLKASSFYFPFSSPWHQLSERAHWEGKDTFERDFDWRQSASEKWRQPQKNYETMKIGFRCLRTVYQDERP